MRATAYRGFPQTNVGNYIPDVRTNTEPLVPSRGHLQPVHVLGFLAHQHSGDALAGTIQAIHELVHGVQAGIVNESDQDAPGLRQAFDIQRLPSLVISVARPGEEVGIPAEGASPLYCVIDDPEIMDDQPSLTAAVVSLVGMVSAATAREIAIAIRGCQFRMLVWKASARAGWPVPYIHGITVRLVAGGVMGEVRFDENGWATSVTADQPAAA